MSHLDPDRLAAAALGEPIASSDPDHLADCPHCRSAVAELRRTHELSMAARDAQGGAAQPWEAPPPHVFAAVLAEIESPATSGASADRDEPAAGSTDRGVARSDESRPSSRPSRRIALGWLVGVAAGGVVIGWLGGRALTGRPAPTPTQTTEPTATSTAPTPVPTPVSAVALTTLDTAEQRGVATVLQAGSAVELEITTDDLGSTPGYFEVWLINTDGKRMVSVGILDAPSATFPISAELLADGYRIVDVSREQFDDKPAHSGDSVVRGTLPL